MFFVIFNVVYACTNTKKKQTNLTHVGPRLIVPTLDQSRRSSLSESSAVSGLSSASTRTYTHEASTLVLETLENGVKRFECFRESQSEVF